MELCLSYTGLDPRPPPTKTNFIGPVSRAEIVQWNRLHAGIGMLPDLDSFRLAVSSLSFSMHKTDWKHCFFVFFLSFIFVSISHSPMFSLQLTLTQLIMYHIRPLPYDSVTVTIRFWPGFSTKCMGYYTNCIGAVTHKSDVHQYNSYCYQYVSFCDQLIE